MIRAGEASESAILQTDPVRFTLVEESLQETDSLIRVEKEKKSVLRAALYSAVIPGSGQYYAGSTWKAILFAGIEVASWTAYFIYTGKGDNEEDTMMAFAEARREGIQPFCITVDNTGNDHLKFVSDPRSYLLIDDAYSLPSVLPKIVESLMG